ncbi:MAG: hypothetical protein DCO96_11300 [Fluviicola sp. XM-24bin1]|nr:MAG: hypothetical protein DCO96_11300 [Fluviicola sp. XM-24bin1]
MRVSCKPKKALLFTSRILPTGTTTLISLIVFMMILPAFKLTERAFFQKNRINKRPVIPIPATIPREGKVIPKARRVNPQATALKPAKSIQKPLILLR